MKPYFFLVTLCFLITNNMAFSQTSMTGMPAQPTSALAYPAIQLSSDLAQKIFLDNKRRFINCPMLFDNSWDYPNGATIALCDDAQLACLRYGLLIKEIETAEGKLLAELQKTLVLEKQEIRIRLRGCELALKRTIDGESLQDAAGYPESAYGPGSPSP